jgi:tetratricopeptide (TPR) repeat protein
LGRLIPHMRFVNWRLCAVLLILHSTTLLAQVSSSARISGSVSDQEGNPVRAATVTMAHRESGTSATTTTDERGRFVVLGLRPGVWRFEIAAPGYTSIAGDGALRAGIDVNPPIDAILRPGGAVLGSIGGIPARDIQTDLATADSLFSQQRWDDAIGVYRSILTKIPVLTQINLQIAMAYRRKGDFESAIATYNALLKAEPSHEKAKVGVALAYLGKGDRAAAETWLLEAVKSEDTGPELFFQLGEMRFEDGSLDEAMMWYRKAAAADSSWGKPLYKLGLSAAKKGDRATARDFLTRAMTMDPASPEAALARTELDRLGR